VAHIDGPVIAIDCFGNTIPVVIYALDALIGNVDLALQEDALAIGVAKEGVDGQVVIRGAITDHHYTRRKSSSAEGHRILGAGLIVGDGEGGRDGTFHGGIN